MHLMRIGLALLGFPALAKPGKSQDQGKGKPLKADWLKLMAPVSYDALPGIWRSPGTRLYYHDNRLIRVSEETRVILDVVNLLTK